MERPIEGPEPYSQRLDSTAAGQWTNGITDEAFDALMAIHLPTVQPIYVAKKKLWCWMDVAVLNYILSRGTTKDPREKRAKVEHEDAK